MSINLVNVSNGMYPFVADLSNYGAISILLAQIYTPGLRTGEVYLQGPRVAQNYNPGMKAGRVVT